MIKTLLTGGANMENVQTDKQIPYEQKELQQALEGKNFDKSKPVLNKLILFRIYN
ncbi:hypothetical protein [Bacillus cereus]|uniref:hypothetical protein n=1 Tax=Bacillus cereus TaxID=1396 RepID=UPI0002791891|nr:hypothetical protein [Bacillus cereus]EJP84075.1 hypothetical protein IC3_05016 [Bacillus cereus VD142]